MTIRLTRILKCLFRVTIILFNEYVGQLLDIYNAQFVKALTSDDESTEH